MKKKIPKEFLHDNSGINNQNLNITIDRLQKGNTYKDLSTIWVTPTRGTLHNRVVSSWMSISKPMNQTIVGPLFFEGDEVGIAYQKAFELILNHPELSKFKYILTVEEDNLPPTDGLLKLYESIEKGYDCVAGLYFTKSSTFSEIYSQPMIYGDPNVMPRNFIPQIPIADYLQHCNGLGMGFNLWKISSLKKKLKDLPQPWFKTTPNFTQDLWFFNEAAKYGYKVACDTRVKVGHIDLKTSTIW